jgi:hypothetical protein
MNYLTVQLETDRELNRVLELAARQSSARVRKLRGTSGIGAQVRAAQLQSVLAEIAKIQADTWVSGIGPIIQRSYPKAQAAATRAFKAVENVFIAAVGKRRAAPLIESTRIATTQGLELDRLRRARDLSPRVYKNAALASGAVERTIRAGLIQNLSAKELAENVEKYISPKTPGGVSYAAMRLARTEINNAFHEAQKIEGEAPWVRGVKWNLSNSHPTSRPDKCDAYARLNSHGMGRGIFPVGNVPDKPHPHCLCYLTYETMSEKNMVDVLANIIAGPRVA